MICVIWCQPNGKIKRTSEKRVHSLFAHQMVVVVAFYLFIFIFLVCECGNNEYQLTCGHFRFEFQIEPFSTFSFVFPFSWRLVPINFDDAQTHTQINNGIDSQCTRKILENDERSVFRWIFLRIVNKTSVNVCECVCVQPIVPCGFSCFSFLSNPIDQCLCLCVCVVWMWIRMKFTIEWISVRWCDRLNL